MQLFDRYGADYGQAVQDSINFSGLRHDFFLSAKADLLGRIVAERLKPGGGHSLLDVGCGVGAMHGLLGPSFARICGVDVSQRSIDVAREQHPGIEYRSMTGSEIPYEDRAFDVVTAVCVLHHVVPAERARFMAELERVARPGGLVCVIEHNPLNPLTQLAVMRCPFDKDARLLSAGNARRLLAAAGLVRIETRHFLLFPVASPMARRIEAALAGWPLGAQYVAVGERFGSDTRQPRSIGG